MTRARQTFTTPLYPSGDAILNMTNAYTAAVARMPRGQTISGGTWRVRGHSCRGLHRADASLTLRLLPPPALYLRYGYAPRPTPYGTPIGTAGFAAAGTPLAEHRAAILRRTLPTHQGSALRAHYLQARAGGRRSDAVQGDSLPTLCFHLRYYHRYRRASQAARRRMTRGGRALPWGGRAV